MYKYIKSNILFILSRLIHTYVVVYCCLDSYILYYCSEYIGYVDWLVYIRYIYNINNTRILYISAKRFYIILRYIIIPNNTYQ